MTPEKLETFILLSGYSRVGNGQHEEGQQRNAGKDNATTERKRSGRLLPFIEYLVDCQ